LRRSDEKGFDLAGTTRLPTKERTNGLAENRGVVLVIAEISQQFRDDQIEALKKQIVVAALYANGSTSKSLIRLVATPSIERVRRARI